MRIMITGATSGIGKALALAYSNDGHEVIACGRNPEKLAQLSQGRANIRTLCFDLTQYQDYPDLEQSFPELAHEALDILIFNAGDCEYIDDVMHFDAQRFEKIININLISVAYGLQAWLSKIKMGGRLVLVSSSVQYLPLSRAEAYGASKAALTYLGRTLSIDLAQHKIAVTLVHPGFVDTPLTERNKFAMPMLVTSELAAEKIIHGIAKGKSDISFPGVFIFIINTLALLPFSLWRKLAIRMTK
jgi:NAD(P)-dependent dehydrogenase (short-subunit alcohol dehydrogenase family)